MKNIKYPASLSFLLLVFIILCDSSHANWKSNEAQNIQQTPDTPDTPYTEHSKSDSLPEGVTEDWLNSLTDENGDRIIQESNNSSTSREIPEDPEGDAFQRKIFNGQGASNFFGYSVSSAGDVNGDGYSDIIVGAHGFSTFSGKAYIFYSGLIMNTIANVTMTGEAANNFFGWSVSAAGDVNGDGYSDVIVGAFGNSSNTGKAYIYFGGAIMNNTADVIMSGVSTNYYFGRSVSAAGDVNGDGYSDVIVGADGYSSNTGRAYIYFGGAVMNNTEDVTLTGGAVTNYFGRSVSSAGDVNGDGYSDVIVGADGYSSNTGRAYVFFGGASPDNVADVTMTGEASNNYFGFSVSKAGDINGDGFSDVIVGARGYSSFTGRAYVYLGGTSVDNIADVIMTGEATNNFFGRSVSTAGDINGDGYSDVIVGADGYSSNSGRVYIYSGGVTINNVADVTLTGEAAGNEFGRSVSSAGDVNGNGYSDIIVGANSYNSNTGRVYLFDYFMKNEITQDLTISGGGTEFQIGTSVSSAGDVNGDGYSDVIVGGDNNFSNGRAYIFMGGPSMDNVADVTMTGEGTGSLFGKSVSSAGDVNGDGYSDVIVGAWNYSLQTGRAYLYFGGVSMDNVPDIVMTGETTNSNFGRSVSTAGDVNNDGYSDVIVGAEAYSSYTGRAYIYFGGASMDNVADVTLTGEAINNLFGISASGAGDVNRDGYSDVIVGAEGYSSNKGKGYIFFGGASMNNVADVTMTGEGDNDYFANSVSTAGDINGDGYSDVVIGSIYYSLLTGKAYVYFGGTLMNNIADVTITSGTPGIDFGSSVSSAGDVNGDGYSDFIIGARRNSTPGRAFIFFGGASPDSIPDVSMTGEATGNYFGNSVSSAGDVNGDGYSDVIVGAFGYSSNTGRAYLYNGSAISAKPIFSHVKDVPNDQGGFVNLKWVRSSYDVNGNDLVTYYLVERSYPPVNGNFAWANIAEITASKNPFYTIDSPTPYDSSSGSNGIFFYRITAKTSIASQYWRSGILSGRSIDNISPPMVSPFTAASAGSNVNLNWGASPAPDLKNYILFRSTSPTIDPYTATPLSTLTSTAYVDTSPLNGKYYYFIVAQDIHNNYSPVAVTESPNITVNLTMFIEGFYNSATDLQVSDTIKTTLRSTVSPYNIIGTADAVVSPSGNAVLNFGNAPGGTYFLVIKHRNSIETWSASPITVTSGGSVSYNFSTVNTQAFGNNMKQVDTSPLRFGIYSGDQNQNGIVDLTDIVNVSNAASLFTNGYVSTDMNGDNISDLTDIVITSNNASGFVTVTKP